MSKYAIISSSRADYNYLLPVYRALKADFAEFWLTGQHFLPEYGNYYQTIMQEIPQARQFPMLGFSQTQNMDARGMADGIAAALATANQALCQYRPQLAIILGDRFEIFGFALGLFCHAIPICHLAGGDISLGAKDDEFRHMISRMARIHCPTHQASAENLIKMGINSEHIFNIGATNYDLIKQTTPKSRAEILNEFGFAHDRPLMLVTVHSETHHTKSAAAQAQLLMNFLGTKDEIWNIIITGTNMDDGGWAMRHIIAQHTTPAMRYRENLGATLFYQTLQHTKVMVGNSSAGLYEAALLGCATVNIGQRQAGRFAPKSVFHADWTWAGIEHALHQAGAFQNFAQLNLPYGDGHAADKLRAVLHGLGF